MSYVDGNPKSKKLLKQWISSGKEVRCFQPGMGPDLSQHTGVVYLEGPHFPQPHKWYAQGRLERGVLISIK